MTFENIGLTQILIAVLTITLPACFKLLYDLQKLRIDSRKKELINNKLRTENKHNELKLDFLNRIMDLTSVNQIIEAIEKVFTLTKADRFLILVAVNGKEDFNVVSVIFEQHKKNYKVNAIGTYRNIRIDQTYKQMLKNCEVNDVITLCTKEMPNSLLKSFYEVEGVQFSKVRFLARKPIDGENDFLVFSSLATHNEKDFTPREKTIIKTIYETAIKPNINNVLK